MQNYNNDKNHVLAEHTHRHATGRGTLISYINAEKIRQPNVKNPHPVGLKVLDLSETDV